MMGRRDGQSGSTRRGARGRGAACASGFTVIELLITFVIVAGLAAAAMPAFMNTIRDTRLTTTAEMLQSDLLIARRESIKRNLRILVCPTGGTVDDKCSTNYSTWQLGWQVCSVPSTAASNTCDTTVPTIIERSKLDAGLKLTGPAAALRFNSNGTAAAASEFTVQGNWTGSASYKAKIAASGNIMICKVGQPQCS